MANNCISCKRDILSGQKNCYICGSSQSYFRFYFARIIIFSLLLIVMAIIGYGYLTKMNAQINQANLKIIQDTNQKNQRIFEMLRSDLLKAEERVISIESANRESNLSTTESQLELSAAQQKSKKAEERSNWLSKENRRLKRKIKELNDEIMAGKIQSKEAKSSNLVTGKISPDQLGRAKIQLVDLQTRERQLQQQIEATTKSLQLAWSQQNNDSSKKQVQIDSERQSELAKATEDNNEQIKELQKQIEAVKKTIESLTD
jgi:chromosome segregation ATPase